MNRKITKYIVAGVLSALVLSGCSAMEQMKDFVQPYWEAVKEVYENQANNGGVIDDSQNNEENNAESNKDTPVESNGNQNENQENNPVEEKAEVVSVKFQHDFISQGDGDMDECAVVLGMDASGNVVWKYETDRYEATQLDRIADIGQQDDIYYFVEDIAIVALNVSDGTVLWRNEEFCGGGAKSVFGPDGILYVCGYFGPDFFAVDSSGKTLHRVECFDQDYIWPYKLEYQNGEILITFESSPLGDSIIGRINLENYTIRFPE